MTYVSGTGFDVTSGTAGSCLAARLLAAMEGHPAEMLRYLPAKLLPGEACQEGQRAHRNRELVKRPPGLVYGRGTRIQRR